MKILEVAEGSKHTGSAAAALTSARALAARGHQVTWLCQPGSALAEAGRGRGLDVREELELSLLGLRASARRIREAAADFDLVHVHRSKSHLAAAMGLGFSGRTKPLVRTCHAGAPGQTGVWARWLAGKSDALVVRSAALAFAMSRVSSPEGARLGVIPGGVDGSVFNSEVDGAGVRGELGLDAKLAVGIVSNLKAGRRLPTFCAAAEKLSRNRAFDVVDFLIIGRGELGKSLQGWIDRSHLTSRLRIFSPGEKFPQALAALDVGVLLVPGSDGSGRAALEMAALGKPLVLGRVGALADLAGPEGDCARTVAPDSADELAAAIGELADDSERRARLGEAARARFEQRHTLERLGENYEKFLFPLVEGGS
jgi:glycosyltransferase involved in cell wall biosynthesis